LRWNNRASFWQTPPDPLAANTRGTINVRHADDLEMTWGEATYQSGEGKAQTEFTSSCKGRAGEIRAKGLDFEVPTAEIDMGAS
jgi:hypothetical protein